MDKKKTVSIGLPVFNGEKFLQKKIENIVSQTYKNFELIISDNSSTDSTSRICEDFAKNDKRVKFFHQERNIGVVENFNFVLKKATGDYFLWTSVDDFLHPKFIEKNMSILEIHPNVVCSVSKMKLYGEKTESLVEDKNDSIVKKKTKDIQKRIGFLDTFSASGVYEKRIEQYFKNLRHNQIFYGVFRTKQLKESHVTDSFLWFEACTILNILKFGELFVVDEVLMEVYDGGMSRSGMISVTKNINQDKIGRIFPNYHFTSWCFENLSKQIFLKNLGFFIKVNCIGLFSLGIDLIRRVKKVN